VVTMLRGAIFLKGEKNCQPMNVGRLFFWRGERERWGRLTVVHNGVRVLTLFNTS